VWTRDVSGTAEPVPVAYRSISLCYLRLYQTVSKNLQEIKTNYGTSFCVAGNIKHRQRPIQDYRRAEEILDLGARYEVISMFGADGHDTCQTDYSRYAFNWWK